MSVMRFAAPPVALSSGSAASNAMLRRVASKKLLSLEQRLTEPSQVRHDESDRLYERLFNSRRHRHVPLPGQSNFVAQEFRRDALDESHNELWRSSSGVSQLLPHIVEHFLLNDMSDNSVTIKAAPTPLQVYFLFVIHADSQWFGKYLTAEIVRQMTEISGVAATVAGATGKTVHRQGHTQKHAQQNLNKGLMHQCIATHLRQLRVLGKLLGLLTFSPYWVR